LRANPAKSLEARGVVMQRGDFLVAVEERHGLAERVDQSFRQGD
jgi:hypothetical protein